jgi:hypothetical protein
VLDGRTLVARRRRELIDVYTAALGVAAALTESQRVAVRKAAELTALSEQARADAMRQGISDPIRLSAMIRLESTATRAVKALGIKPGERKLRTIDDYLQERAAKAASKPAGDPA